MTKPVTGLTVFGSNTTGTTTQLDNNFIALQTAVNDYNTYPNYLADTGSANTMAVALPASVTGALSDGLTLQIKANATNTAATVLNYNATGNANVVNMQGNPLAAGSISSGAVVQVQYSNTAAAWFLQTPTPGVAPTKASMQSGNSNGNGNYVTPGVLQYHDGVAKATGVVNESGGTYTLDYGYNVTSANKNGTGNVIVTWTTAFANANYAIVVTPGGNNATVQMNSRNAGNVTVLLFNSTTGAAVNSPFTVTAYGRQ